MTGLRIVTPSDQSSPNTGGQSKGISSVSLVFDALHGDANSIALRAAEYLLKQTAEKNFYFSVWRLTTRLELTQTLTNDQPILKRAIETTLKQTDGGKPQAVNADLRSVQQLSLVPDSLNHSRPSCKPQRLSPRASPVTKTFRRSLPVCWRSSGSRPLSPAARPSSSSQMDKRSRRKAC